MRLGFSIPGTRKLILGLTLGLSAFITAHIVNAFVGQALLVQDMLPPPLPSHDDALQHSVSPQQLAQDLMDRGLFALPPESSQNAGSSTGAGLGPPLDVAKKLLLQGTALGNSNAPMAIIQDRTNQQQKLLHLHDRVPNVGELVSIEKTRVLFKEGGQEEWLELAMLTDLNQAQRIPPLPESIQGQLPALSQPPRSIHLAGLTRMVPPTSSSSPAGSSKPPQILDRREVTKALSDMPILLLQAQPVVSMVEGRFNGILLDAVKHEGLYDMMGLLSGDVLKRINGVEIRDPSMVIAVLQQMKDERSVKLDIVRYETPRTLTVEIH
jgi:general secretion pathway protein C